MSQVFVEMTKVTPSDLDIDTPVSDYVAQVEEVTSSGTSQATSISTNLEDGYNIVTVINNGTDTVWVNFGATATAAGPSRPVAPNTTRDFGGVPKSTTVSVINDS